MSEITRQQKITFGEMRASGVHGLLIYCSDYKCGHLIAINPNESSRTIGSRGRESDHSQSERLASNWLRLIIQGANDDE